jgi:hypothetical protein
MTTMDGFTHAPERTSPRGGLIAALTAGAGALTATAGALLPWLVNPSGAAGIEGGSIAGSFGGVETPLGIATLVAGAASVLLALLWLAIPRVIGVAAPLVVMGAIVIVACAGYVLLTARERFVDIAAATSANPQTSSAEIRDFFPRFLVANDISIEPGVGLYLAAAGGAVSLVGGAIGIMAARRRTR